MNTTRLLRLKDNDKVLAARPDFAEMENE